MDMNKEDKFKIEETLNERTVAMLLEPDARGYSTFMIIKEYKGKVVDVRIDAFNYSEDAPYGPYKVSCPRYNEDMYNESGTRYATAVRILREGIIEEGVVLRVGGAKYLSQDVLDMMGTYLNKEIRFDQALW